MFQFYTSTFSVDRNFRYYPQSSTLKAFEMKGVLLLLSGVCLLVVMECRINDEVFVPVLVPQLQHNRERRQAPSVNVHKIPKTSFTCDGKTSGEYYADTETKCQVYHVCIAGFRGKMNVMSFVCPNGTIFSQASRVCTPYDRVDCALTSRFYETVHGDPNIHLKDVQGVTSAPRTTVHRDNSRSKPTGRQSQARAPPRHTRPTAVSSTSAPRVTRPQVPRGPQSPPRTFRTSVVSTSTAAYDYDYEYEYEEDDKNDRSKRDTDSLGLLSFDWSRYPIMTGFSCDDKVTGAFYADIETNCEMVHICVPIAKKKLIDHKFFCAEGKAYNQQTGYCEEKSTFNCSLSPKFFKYDKIQSYFARKSIAPTKKPLTKTVVKTKL